MNQARIAGAALAALVSLGLVLFLARGFLIELALVNPVLFLLAAITGIAVGRLSSLPWTLGLLAGDALVVASYFLMWVMYWLAGRLPDVSALGWFSWTLMIGGSGLIIGTLTRSPVVLRRFSR